MKILFSICAFSACLASVISQPGGEYGWQSSWQHSAQSSSQASSSQSILQPILQQRTQVWQETIVKEWGHSEVAFWRNDQLFFLDTYGQNLCSYHTKTGLTYILHISRCILSFAVPVKGEPDKFVVGCGTTIVMVKWDGSSTGQNTRPFVLRTLQQRPHEPLPLFNRVGYGSVDYEGILWFATTNDNPEYQALKLGRVYSISKDGFIEKKIVDLRSVTGGFTWDRFRPNKKTGARPRPYTFMYADTLNREIIGYDLQIQSEIFDKSHLVMNMSKPFVLGEPGRIAIDERGWLWVPLLGGHRVVEFNPFTQRVFRVIELPAAKVGACAFGGPQWNILYVSTIGYGNTNEKRPLGDYGGHIYAIHGLDVTGLPTREYALKKTMLRRAYAALDDISLRVDSGGGRPKKGGPPDKKARLNFDLNH